MSRCILFVFAAALFFDAHADVLRTSRSANIKEEPLSSSTTVEHVNSGVELELLDDGTQTNGYYQVRTSAGNTGWIYRTLVRRFSDASGTTPSSGTSSGTGAASPSTVTATASDVEVTVIDVGAGLSCLIKMPGNKFIVYDGGKSSAFKYLKNTLPQNSTIELMVLSHTDADHWGAVEDIVTNYHVKSVLRTDFRVSDFSQTYINGITAIENANGLNDFNLGEEGDLTPGKVLYDQGGAKLVALCGFQKPPAAWGTLSDSKANNAVSIVVRLEYKNHSILFGGDAVGREDCATGNECIASEKFMLDNSGNLLNSDVIVVPHHGADNASCQTFIEKVSPEFVVFSAGHAFRHPRQITAERYLSAGVDQENIFRTDRGDHEPSNSSEECKLEWSSNDSGTEDKPLDDNIRIVLPKTGKVKVGYIN